MLISVLLLVGCEPTDGVTWLPDSSGFVVVQKARGFESQEAAPLDLYLFDTVSKTSTPLLTETESRTLRPALSPDGKLIALGRLEIHSHKPSTLSIIFIDRNGKEQKRSTPFSVIPTPRGNASTNDGKSGVKKPSFGATWLVWEQRSQKLVVFGRGFGTAIYDPNTDQLRRLGGVMPGWYGGTAVPPDGRGILTIGALGDKLEMNLIEWDGTRHPIAATLPAGNADGIGEALLPLKIFPSWWEGSTAVAASRAGIFRIDTARRVATFKPRSKQGTLVDGKQLLRQHEFPDTLGQLRFLHFEEERVDGSIKNRVAFMQVELFDPRSSERRTVLPRIPSPDVDVAPNGKWVALRSENRIWVVDSHGQVVADFKVGEHR
jgi:hypothetical protein